MFPIVLASIDTDADGLISEAEQRAYAMRVLRDVSLTIDGDRLWLRLISINLEKTEDTREGLGEIQLDFDADVPLSGPNRKLVFENHHQSRIGAYLVNYVGRARMVGPRRASSIRAARLAVAFPKDGANPSDIVSIVTRQPDLATMTRRLLAKG